MSIARTPVFFCGAGAAKSDSPEPPSEVTAAANPPCRMARRETPSWQLHTGSFFIVGVLYQKLIQSIINDWVGFHLANRTLFARRAQSARRQLPMGFPGNYHVMRRFSRCPHQLRYLNG